MPDDVKFPKELQDLNQWICWKEQVVNDRLTKVPYNCNNGGKASTTDPETWCSHEKAVNYANEHDVSGIGFVITEKDPYTWIDIDDCIKDGEIAKEAQDIIEIFNSYTEKSQSGKGIHICVRGDKKGTKCKCQKLDWCKEVEIYDKDRYFALTGSTVEGHFNIKSKQRELNELYDELFSEDTLELKPKQAEPTVITLSLSEVLTKAMRAENSEKFALLHNGDWKSIKEDGKQLYKSQSEADLAYYSILAFWCNKNRDLMERIFETSKLKRDKWKNRKDYRDRLYNKVYESVKETYSQSEIKKSLMNKYDVYKWRTTKDGGAFIAGIKPQGLAKLIINETDYHFVTLEEKNKPIWYYNGKHYKSNGEIKIGAMVLLYTGEYFNKHIWNEVVAYIQCSNIKTRLDFNPPLHLINVDNGVYNLKTGKLEPHSHEHLFLSALPVTYDKNAKCPNYEKFLKEITTKDTKKRLEVYNTLQEYLGYCLYRDYIIKKYLIMDGDQDNGKTTIMNVWVDFLGEYNIASIPLQELNDKPFRKHKLYGKLGNFADDLPQKAVRYGGIVKQITGRSPIWADIKNHAEGIRFINYAKPFFTCNELPETSDKGNAFFERQLQVSLFNKYIRKNDPKIDNETIFERDLDICLKCTTPEELSGIFNHALIGLNRLLENKRFSDMTTTEENRENWIRKSDPILTYLKDNIEETSKDFAIISKDLEKSIRKYCKEHRISKDITPNKITRKLSEQDIIKKHKMINGEQKWVFLGIQHITDETLNHCIGEKNKSQYQRVDEIREYADARGTNGASLFILNNLFDKSTVAKLIESGKLIKLPNGNFVWSAKK